MRANRLTQSVCAILAAGSLMAISACSSDGSDEKSEEKKDPAPSPTMDMSMMGDPKLPAANTIEDADLSSGEFQLLDTRPPNHDEVSGTAWLAQSAEGTTLTVGMSGLTAKSEYMTHLHSRPCSEDNGGPHFKFDENGSSKPPNEVHLMLHADEQGAVSSTIRNAKKVGDQARSIVIHPTEAMDNRIACADFS